MSQDRNVLRAHEDWIGLVQPTGLVVSPAALVAAGAFVGKDVLVEQQALQQLVDTVRARDGERAGRARVDDFGAFARAVLSWAETDLVDDPAQLQAVEVPLSEWGETLRVTYVVPAPPNADGTQPAKPLMLVKVLPVGMDFDDSRAFPDRQWQASAQGRFERILRESDVPIGILWNGEALRLVYLPKGEVSGHMTFPIAALLEVANRPMLSALKLLLGAERLFTLDQKFRLPALLQNSRKVQNQVSTELAEQFLVALAELLRGFQAADRASNGQLLNDFRSGSRGYDDVYGGLLSVLLRLVFVLYAEDRDLLPDDDVYRDGYSVRRLYERLRDDADAYPDTMDQRYGAWAQLLSLFRLVHAGAVWPSSTPGAAPVKLPAREGRLFNPDTYPFLEGRSIDHRVQQGERLPPPRVSDGVVLRVLESLLLLDGQKLSYRTLDVEQIGSVYEGLMGFTIDVAEGTSVAVLPHHVVVDLDAVLAKKPAERAAVFDEVKCKLTAKQQAELKAAKDVDGVVKALGNKVSRRMPLLVTGSLFLQPTDERRRSGSHYTPRALTEPIVATALRPILERLDDEAKKAGKPGITPEQLLDLKVCDPAMGSGAFLVQAARQLGALLVEAWARTSSTPKNIPPDETPLLHATRLVATRCLYGVDKNPLAVELAKLSLWLDTLAKDHPFTFLDHSLREGDSLVGLSISNLRAFSWRDYDKARFATLSMDKSIARAEAIRLQLEKLGDVGDDGLKARMLKDAENAADQVRMFGDAVVAAFFASDKPKEQLAKLDYAWVMAQEVINGRSPLGLRGFINENLAGVREMNPFHWELEFPEVFLRDDGGFDSVIGNPPFAGKNTLAQSARTGFSGWLATRHGGATGLDSHGNADLVAHFFRRAFSVIRRSGTMGLIATKTISEGDTRDTGLVPILRSGGVIYSAEKSRRWPGQAGVRISVVHIARQPAVDIRLNGRTVSRISAFLLPAEQDSTPPALAQNQGLVYQGYIYLGAGFTFDDSKSDKGANSLSDLEQLVKLDPVNQRQIFPLIGGGEILDDPRQRFHRYVIDLSDLDEERARSQFPHLMRIVEERVRPDRQLDGRQSYRKYWWQFAEKRPELRRATAGMSHVFVQPFPASYLSVAKIPTSVRVSAPHNVFCSSDWAFFAVIQSRPHEIWATLFGSSLEDRFRYTPSTCFDNFAFPQGDRDGRRGPAGQTYYEQRSAIMIANEEGLTATYKRFHDPDHDGSGIEGRDPRDVIKDIETLRTLHDEMDRAVLDAYGWTDIRPKCEFLLDYEEEDDDEDEGETKKRKKKKPWRYRWPDDVRDEVLARLLELNKKYAEEEKAQHQESQAKKDTDSFLSNPLPTTKKKASTKKPTSEKPQLVLVSSPAPSQGVVTIGEVVRDHRAASGLNEAQYAAQHQLGAATNVTSLEASTQQFSATASTAKEEAARCGLPAGVVKELLNKMQLWRSSSTRPSVAAARSLEPEK